MKPEEYRELKKKFMVIYKLHKKNSSMLEKLFPLVSFDFKGNTCLLSWDSAYTEIKRNTDMGKTALWVLKRKGVL